MTYFRGIEIEINHHCNLACPYCPNSTSQRTEQGLMTKEFFTKILDQLKDINFAGQICYHFYNEPLLHPHLDLFVELSKKYLPLSKSHLYSNGMFLTLQKFELLKKSGVDQFTITKHTGVKSLAFDQTWNMLNDDDKKMVNYIDHSRLILTNRGGLISTKNIVNEEINKRPCLIPFTKAVITVDGNVLGCYEDYQQKNIMGNINTSTLEEIWNSEKYIKFRSDLKKGYRANYEICNKCDNRIMF